MEAYYFGEIHTVTQQDGYWKQKYQEEYSTNISNIVAFNYQALYYPTKKALDCEVSEMLSSNYYNITSDEAYLSCSG